MTKNVYSALLIGLGDIGLNYDLSIDRNIYVQTHASSLSLHKGFELLAGVDINPDACKKFTKEYSINAFTSINDALTHNKPDLIILAVPTASQNVVLNKIISLHIPKAILCEKPMGTDLANGERILNTCKKNDISLYVNYIRRCLPESLEVKDRIQKNIMKTPMKSIIWYSKGIAHNGAHFINLLEYWFGKAIEIITFDKGREFNNYGFEPLIGIKFDNCEVIMVPAWEEFYSHYTIEIISSSGRLYWNNEKLIWNSVAKTHNLNEHRYLSNNLEYIKTESNKYQMHVLNALHDAMIGKDSSICNGDEALQTLKTINQILS